MVAKPSFTHHDSRGTVIATRSVLCWQAAATSVWIGVAADDPVHDHDVCGRGRIGVKGEIADASVDPPLEATIGDQCAGGGFIGVDEFDVRGVSGTGLEELDLQVADATADLEHRSPCQCWPTQTFEDPACARREALFRVSAGVAFNGLGSEDGAVSGRCAAAHRTASQARDGVPIGGAAGLGCQVVATTTRPLAAVSAATRMIAVSGLARSVPMPAIRAPSANPKSRQKR